jgi:hypothetical protein
MQPRKDTHLAKNSALKKFIAAMEQAGLLHRFCAARTR